MEDVNEKNKELLDELMHLTITELISVIKSGEANSSVLNVARQLLKDNQVMVAAKQGTSFGDLVDILPFDEQIAAEN